MSSFGSQIACFLAHKRALGFAYRREQAFLEEIARLASSQHEEILSEALVRQYLSSWTEASRPHRLTVVRVLAQFLVIEEPRTFIPPRRLLGIRQRRPPIRVFSRDEAVRFLAACDVLPEARIFPLGLVHSIALRTLLLTGLRRGELLALRDEDVDLSQEILTVRCGKFGKSRFVPLASDLAQRLRVYREEVSVRIAPRQPSSAFFPRPDGHLHTALNSLYKSFRQVLTLGHVGLTSSQVYLHMTEDFVGELTRRQLDRFGDLITEVAQ